MSTISVHDDWLSLIEISGPFLAVPVLKEAFPQGLEELDGVKRKRLRQAYEEWREALELEDAQFAELHAAWIDEVLSRGLELDEDRKGDVLKPADWCAVNLQASLPEHGVTLSPDLVVIDEQRVNKPLLLIQTYAQDVDLDASLKRDGWAATPADRMVQLCRSLGCRLGLVTNGERWMLVDAPVGAVSTFASWYARIWSQEPITLQAFVHLLGIRRFFVDESEQLPALFDRSLKFQDEVTDALGEQVRRAVEVLIQTLDKADQDRNRELLRDVKEPELYEAALTVMMRLVFLLSAEERGLLLMGEERYEANYALSTLRMQLRKESEEILERRWDAWSRLLAIFRAVFGGIKHENLRLPALGGSLFDPDRFPFLEGRAKGSNWRTDAAKPLPIDNRTVLLLLEAIQQLQGRTLSYRALDVEQIGYVYEGLLERTVKRTDAVTLELDATKSAKTPWVKLAELDSARLDGAARLAELLQERSGSSASRVRNVLAKPVDDALADRLLTACQGDTKLRDRVKPYAHLLRTDPWGYPLVYPAGAFIVTIGSDRRETGTHYTPKSLTEAIVAETLTPVAYVGPAEGTPRDRWALKSPAELLDLKICDPAMGSGAFLVQACRWLSDRLVEAWSLVEATGKTVSVDGEVLDAGLAREPLPRDSEARTVIARRLIAERCLYGVDLNPLAVELAKLSIWLVTLAKGRPFGFLDHNLRCGDSLLGIHRLDQLIELSIVATGKGQQRLFGQSIERAVQGAIKLRQQLRAMPIRDIHDIEAMAGLDADARRALEVPERIADALICDLLASGGNAAVFETSVASLAVQVGLAIDGDVDAIKDLTKRSIFALSADLPASKEARRPFHWPLEFPEVFAVGRAGFSAIVGNPPWGSATDPIQKQWMGMGYETIGDYEFAIAFSEQATRLVCRDGVVGLVLPNTVLLNESARQIRRRLTLSSWLLWIADLTDHQIFRGASVRCCVIIFKNAISAKHTTQFSRAPGFHLCQSNPIQQDAFASRAHWANLDASEVLIPLGALRIEDLFFVKQGYKPYDKHALLKRMSEEEAKRIVEEKPWHADSQKDNSYVPELRGRDVVPYAVSWSGLWASYGPWVSNYLAPEWFSNERVLVREIVGKPPRLIIASRYSDFAIHNPSIICIKPKSKESERLLAFLELYLNSDLATAFISQISSKAAKGMFPKVLVKELKELPFPPPQMIDNLILSESLAIHAQIQSGSDLDLVDEFIEKVFGLISAEVDLTEKTTTSISVPTKRGRRSRVSSSESMADLFGGKSE
ncbi:Eco57I restriction-modification methylase domain-containing protein [Pseudomonas sp. BJa3]|uniref:Eco57I restriction-modification methylase domain-containing protein n=1 Tax=Pseudomonas sp. BJa3 TaxID=2986525 RepID=UPI002265E116|nr:TaqI-like C-terminal specificity domain-containing protein [Pseudomonas sp. BJa3]MCX5510759.1 N-6 DNA methylase [Pseudomonas sp. BJa3]